MAKNVKVVKGVWGFFLRHLKNRQGLGVLHTPETRVPGPGQEFLGWIGQQDLKTAPDAGRHPQG